MINYYINLKAHDGREDGNQNLPVRTFTKEFKELLQAVFASQSYFGDFFQGELEALDGVRDNENAFYVKTSDIPVVVGTYDTTATTAMGTGTAKSSRFGQRTEVIYIDTPVPYTWNYAIHEGIDRFTVNNDFETAIADRLELQARAKTDKFNVQHGTFISQNATNVPDPAVEDATGWASITKDNVGAVFNELNKKLVNVGAVGTKIAKVTPDVYAAIIDSGLSTTAKNSDVNISEQEVVKFKGFIIEEIPESLFGTNEVIYAYIAGVAKAFTGIQTVRTIESEDFDGVALQGAARAGEYIPKDNLKAVLKVTVTGA